MSEHKLKHGDTFASWEIEEWIGSGLHSDVYKAWHAGRGEYEALKLLTNTGDRRLNPTPRFEREIELLRKLRSLPSIIPIFDWAEVNGTLGFSMHFIPDPPRTVAELLAEGDRLTLSDVIDIFWPVAHALDDIWGEYRLRHRDVAPYNILIEPKPEGGWTSYLADFGIATFADAFPYTKTENTIVGRLEYAAPERLDEPLIREGDQSTHDDLIDSRADQYSLACCIFEALTGQVPYHVANSAQLDALRVTRPPLPDVLNPSPEFTRAKPILAEALTIDPDDRFETSTEFLVALEDISSSPPKPSPSRRLRLPRARSAAFGLAALFGVVGMVALTLWLTHSNTQDTAPPQSADRASTGPHAASRKQPAPQPSAQNNPPRSPRVKLEVVQWGYDGFFTPERQIKIRPRIRNRTNRTLPIEVGSSSSPLVLSIKGLRRVTSWPSPITPAFRRAGSRILIPPNPNDITTGKSQALPSGAIEYPVATHWPFETIAPHGEQIRRGVREGVLVFNIPDIWKRGVSVKFCYKLPRHTPYCPRAGYIGNWRNQTEGIF